MLTSFNVEVKMLKDEAVGSSGVRKCDVTQFQITFDSWKLGSSLLCIHKARYSLFMARYAIRSRTFAYLLTWPVLSISGVRSMVSNTRANAVLALAISGNCVLAWASPNVAKNIAQNACN